MAVGGMAVERSWGQRRTSFHPLPRNFLHSIRSFVSDARLLPNWLCRTTPRGRCNLARHRNRQPRRWRPAGRASMLVGGLSE